MAGNPDGFVPQSDCVDGDCSGATFLFTAQTGFKPAPLSTSLLENVCGTGARKFEGDGMKCRSDAGMDQVSFDLPSSVAYDVTSRCERSDRRSAGDQQVVPSRHPPQPACPQGHQPGGQPR